MRDPKELTPKQQAHMQKLGRLSGERWKNPEYRKMMIEKQTKIGLRTYR